MRALAILIVVAVVAISIGVTEAQDKQNKTEKAIIEGMAAICNELTEYLWINEEERCVRVIVYMEEIRMINGDKE